MMQDASKQRPIEVIGMLWMQGENDAKDPQAAQAYAGNLRNLVETARRDFGNPGINLPDPEDPASMETVREALAGKDLRDYGWVDCDDLTTVSDRLHFDTKGLKELGSRMAAAFLRLHNPNQEPGKTDASE
jgi:Carbohydrate esterase, sialic acid-specific acetylesterase